MMHRPICNWLLCMQHNRRLCLWAHQVDVADMYVHNPHDGLGLRCQAFWLYVAAEKLSFSYVMIVMRRTSSGTRDSHHPRPKFYKCAMLSFP